MLHRAETSRQEICRAILSSGSLQIAFLLQSKQTNSTPWPDVNNGGDGQAAQPGRESEIHEVTPVQFTMGQQGEIGILSPH